MSASSWVACNGLTIPALPLRIDTASFLFLYPPPITRFLSSGNCSMAVLRQVSDRKAMRLVLFRGLEIRFFHCLRTGVDGPLIAIFWAFSHLFSFALYS